ncbi:DUF1671-domain-containing protein [Neolentinus lepideus HHB14362 ss-1]|uniref:DUF1671-domain-containing protein n=1 Tax=Neolentinus lepideus HHB14362 ss-1 TaxID=1314782 RepID=A0A165TD52_9AGAM|nr:DUF1671-domain-containing protein [Neolentinus lepideus HHB14362 ss-1]
MQGGHDSDVEFVCQVSPSGDLVCQFCQQDLQSLSIPDREDHYDVHFAEFDDTHEHNDYKLHSTAKSMSSPPKSMFTPRKPKKLFSLSNLKDVDRNLFWHPHLDTPPPPNFTPGLIPLLHRTLSANPSVTHAVLCFDQTTHVLSEIWDRGWGCGYRNFLMACTALLTQTTRREYWDLLENPTPPGVRNLQRWIEDAWKMGYDKEGAEQLKRQLVGTKKWIGTADIHVAFSARGVPSRLVDFTGVARDPSMLTGWVRQYFDKPDEEPKERTKSVVEHLVKKHRHSNKENSEHEKVVMTNKMPLILQHEGHSRSIVGYVVYAKPRGGEEVELLLFDPGRLPKAIRPAALAEYQRMRSGGIYDSLARPARRSQEVMDMDTPSKTRSTGASKPLSASSSKTTASTSRYRSPSVSEMYEAAGSSRARSPSVSEMYMDHSHSRSAGPSSAYSPMPEVQGFKPLPAAKEREREREKASKYFSPSSSAKRTEKEKENGAPGSGRQKLVQTVLHPISALRNRDKGKERAAGQIPKKRKTPEVDEVVSDSEPERERAKRLRRGEGLGEVIEIASSDGEGVGMRGGARGRGDKESEEGRAFGVGEAALRKKDKYQILWFPMEATLSEREREKRKVVTSTKIS